jgi:hypothetical protein
MFLFKKNKKPKCTDISYVEAVFESLKNPKQVIDYELMTYDIEGSDIDYNSFLNLINFYGERLQVKFGIEKIDEINELLYGLPIIFDFKENKIDDNYFVTFYLTPFALENLHVTFCEILLFFVEIKINNDGFIDFTDEFRFDIENQMRPFLVLAAIYFGVGLPLLKRYSVTGSYTFKLSRETISCKYFVPLDPDFLVFAQCLFSFINEENFEKFIKQVPIFNKSTIKEINNCIDFIKSGKSKNSGTNKYGFYWYDKKDN